MGFSPSHETLATGLAQLFLFAHFPLSLPRLHNRCLIPELGGPLEMLCSTHSSAPLQTQAIVLTELINEQNIEQMSSFKGYMFFICAICYIQKIFVH